MVTIVNAAIVYIALMFALRLVGRRSPSLSTPFEIILLFLMGGMGMSAIIGNDHSLTNALLGIATIVLMHSLVAFLKQCSPRLGRIIDGTPIVVFCKGQWHEDQLQRLRVNAQDVMAAARGQGLERLEQVKYAVVERNGAISVVRKEG